MTSVLVNVLVLSLFAVERLILRFEDFVSLGLLAARPLNELMPNMLATLRSLPPVARVRPALPVLLLVIALGPSLVAAPPLRLMMIDESIASDVYAAIKQGMREQRKDAPFHIVKKYRDVVFEMI
ncbi:hypothetical protein Ptr902_09837 [Pyrenophora tritici-repentis]|nr:hypothetical protein Ptr902_09837 [Pyrenophora tritici-repentis]